MTANEEQIDYWNTTAGPKWVALQEKLDAQIGALGEAAMERASIEAEERAIDVGCGCGTTSLELGKRVGEHGDVLAVDVSAPMLAVARKRAEALGLASRVRFEQADAQTYEFDPAYFDLVFSRFGVMFFADPRAAFANLFGALRPGGRLTFVCWQALPKNPWVMVPLGAVAEVLPLPAPPAPGTPGPFAFADADRVSGILAAAGYTDIAVEPLVGTFGIGGTMDLDEVVTFALEMGPTSRVLRDQPPEMRARVTPLVKRALAPFMGPRGLEMEYAGWIFTAGRP